jgi:hypothetical protein
MPPLQAYIDRSCERIHDGLLNEPFNTLSGICFLIVFYFLRKEMQRRNLNAISLKFTTSLIVIIGLGSMIFHTTARMWGALMDSIPIAIFAVTYMVMLSKHILGFGKFRTALLMLLFVAVNVVFKHYVSRAPDGYVSIFPTLFCLVGIAVYMIFSKNPSSAAFSKAVLLSFLAIYFRVIDEQICGAFPVGTHFVWHMIMSGVIYIWAKELIKRYHAVDFKA